MLTCGKILNFNISDTVNFPSQLFPIIPSSSSSAGSNAKLKAEFFGMVTVLLLLGNLVFITNTSFTRQPTNS